jgi:NodT family efflux transporter outer membrane factor (OMF) lipoprotein
MESSLLIRFKGRWSIAGLTLLVCGCVVGPNYRAPRMAMPDSFSEPMPGTAATRPTTGEPTTRPVDLARWWESLDDPELNALERRAIQSGLDLRIALQRLQEAREQEWASLNGYVPGAGGFTGIGFSAGAARGTGHNSVANRVSGPVNAAINDSGRTEITHAFGFDAGWEIDLFGRYSRLTETVEADTQAAIEARNEVLVSLVADVARGYIEVRTLQLRLQIAGQYVEAQRRTADLVQVRLKRGLGNQLDVALAERQLSAALARIAPLQASVAAAERRLAVLLGQFPEALRAELEQPGALPATPPGVATGMPVELLRRRPDVRRAERQLAAASARVGLATADLFPRVALTASTGYQGQGLGRTPVLFQEIYSVGPSLYWPFLDFGRIEAQVNVQDFRAREQFYIYQQTVINAVREVDDALTNYSADQDEQSRLADAIASSKQAVKLATERFKNGLTDFLNVLDAQRELDDLEDQYAVAEQAVATQFIALYKGMGGGWEGYESPPPPLPRPALFAAGQVLLGPHAPAPPYAPKGGK